MGKPIATVPGKPRTKFMDCRTCGVPIEVSAQTVNAPRHFECGISVAMEAMRQMQAKKGPYYDRYRSGMRAYSERINRHQNEGTHSQ